MGIYSPMAVLVADWPVAAGPAPAAVRPAEPVVLHGPPLLPPPQPAVAAAVVAPGPGQRHGRQPPEPAPGPSGDAAAAAARRPGDPPGSAGSCGATYRRLVPAQWSCAHRPAAVRRRRCRSPSSDSPRAPSPACASCSDRCGPSAGCAPGDLWAGP